MNQIRKRSTLNRIPVTFVVVFFFLSRSSATWLYLGIESLKEFNLPASTTDPSEVTQSDEWPPRHEENCRQQSELLRNKVDACLPQNSAVVESVRRGSAIGLLECQWQFNMERWNCSLDGADNDLLNSVLDQGTRETAFIHAVTSAALVHSITTSCSAGLINECTCDQSGHVISSADDGWQWGGCSDNIEYGVTTSQKLIDHLDDAATFDDDDSDDESKSASSSESADAAENGSFPLNFDRDRNGGDDAGNWSLHVTRVVTAVKSDVTVGPGLGRGKTRKNVNKASGSGNEKKEKKKPKRLRRQASAGAEKNEVDHKMERSGLEKSVRSLVNLHNNEVGRKTISSMMAHACRCHGVSGSCAVRTCWRALPDFRKVGDQLKLKYESSVEISPSPGSDDVVVGGKERPVQLRRSVSDGGSPQMSLAVFSTYSPYMSYLTSKIGSGELKLPFYLKRREKRKSKEPISDSELVFMAKSPNYCRENSKKGIWGTKGRRCDRKSTGPNGCHSLCCGRGYKTTVVKRHEKCRCKFLWCCEVICQECLVIEEIHTCK